MKQLNNRTNSIDTPVVLIKKGISNKQEQIKQNGNFLIANKVKLINLSEKQQLNSTTNNFKRSLSFNLSSKSSSSSTTSSVSSSSSSTTSSTTQSTQSNKENKKLSISKTISSKHTPNHFLSLRSKKDSVVSKIDLDKLIMSQSSLTSKGGYALADPNKIHLFVKAGQDGRSQGACPFCQDVFIQLLIKAQSNRFNFDVITINLDNPPKEFKELSIKPPVLIHGSNTFLDENNDDDSQNSSSNAVILSDVDEIAEYLDRLYPNSKLIVDNSEAKKVCLNVFSKFSFFIRDISSKPTSLEAELEKIDNYLRDNTDDEKKFLSGQTMTGLDCSLLPKLHHIRIAAEHIKKFKIPYKFRYLWKYLHNAYQTEAFQKSCPPDREIIWHWSKTNVSNKELLQIMQETAYKTIGIPDDLRI